MDCGFWIGRARPSSFLRSKIRNPKSKFFAQRRGFSALELFVVIGILVVLISIFIPYLLKIREDHNRFRCADNLHQLSIALSSYAATNHGDFPRVIYDSVGNPNGYTCYTGPDGGDPFAKGSTVRPNDVTASLWLLVRLKLATPINFICPSTSDDEDAVDTTNSSLLARGNFRSPDNLSYSYACPFSAAAGYRLNDTRRAEFALMADKNPGATGDESNAALPQVNVPPLQISVANSNNHGKAGQNVLYADGHFASLQTTPYCGVSDEVHSNLHDNIYTALTAKPLESAHYFPRYANGFLGTSVTPSWDSDSYLVPTATDSVPPPIDIAASQPSTQLTWQPATAPLPTTPLPTTMPAHPVPATAPATTQASTVPATTQSSPTTLPTSQPTNRP